LGATKKGQGCWKPTKVCRSHPPSGEGGEGQPGGKKRGLINERQLTRKNQDGLGESETIPPRGKKLGRRRKTEAKKKGTGGPENDQPIAKIGEDLTSTSKEKMGGAPPGKGPGGLVSLGKDGE